MKYGARTSAGFTLVELVVVLAIMGLVLATVVGTKPKSVANRVAVNARAITSSLRLAREQAMVSNSEVVFRIDTETREFGTGEKMHRLPKELTVVLTVAETERVQNSGGIRFYPDGQSSGGDIVLSLDGLKSHVGVNWLTGEARLYP
jgi:general secretion pathway protein H